MQRALKGKSTVTAEPNSPSFLAFQLSHRNQNLSAQIAGWKNAKSEIKIKPLVVTRIKIESLRIVSLPFCSHSFFCFHFTSLFNGTGKHLLNTEEMRIVFFIHHTKRRSSILIFISLIKRNIISV